MDLVENQSDMSQSEGEETDEMAQVEEEEELSQDLLVEKKEKKEKQEKRHRIIIDSAHLQLGKCDCKQEFKDIKKRLAKLENVPQVKAVRQKRKQTTQSNFIFLFYKSNNAESKFPYKFSLGKPGKMSSTLKSKIILAEYEFINIQPNTKKALKDTQQPQQQQQQMDGDDEEEKLTEIKSVVEYGIISYIMACCNFLKGFPCFENGKNMKDFKLTEDLNEEELKELLMDQVLPNVFC